MNIQMYITQKKKTTIPHRKSPNDIEYSSHWAGWAARPVVG
jgi:hypothetical protein